MLEKNYIRKLSLVAMQIDDDLVVNKLTHLVKTQRQLVELDLSSNRMRPALLLDFLLALAQNRSLQSIDLSWNHLIERSELTEVRGGPPSTETVMQISEGQIKKEL
jgi:hypothetical protein